MVAAATPATASSIASYFPLTFPIPTPISHPHLIRAADLPAEEDLLHNPENIRPWLMHIQSIKDRVASTLPSRSEAAADSSPKAHLLGPLNTQAARDGLQEITSIYERALAIFPTNFKLWKGYHLTRQSYVLGFPTAAAQKARKLAFRRGALYKTNVAELLDAAESEHAWEGGLDGVIGYEEWKSLIAMGERMIGWQSTVSDPSGVDIR
jgi:pre-mRNA-splicing factor SYF1